MIDSIIPTQKLYVLLNKVLNILVRKKFGKQYSVRLNSIHFIENRNNIYYFHNCFRKNFFKINQTGINI